MSSPDLPAAHTHQGAGEHAGERVEGAGRPDGRGTGGGLLALLDVAFGFFVWAVHFLVVYVATAIACQLGLGGAPAGARTTFLVVLALVTVAAAAAVALHALRRHRQQRHLPERRTRMTITVGNDAIAVVAIAWQLLAISLVPLCA